MRLTNIFLSKAAQVNANNFFSVLDGGIDNWDYSIPKNSDLSKIPPIRFALVATIELEITELGRLHNLELSLMDQDGKRVIPEIRSNFQAPAGQRKSKFNIILNIDLKPPQPGTYCFYINVDGTELGTHPFTVNFNTIK